MKASLSVIAGCLMLSSVAIAQPEDDDVIPAGDAAEEETRLADPPAPPPAPMTAERGSSNGDRPAAYSVGLGFGYRLPADLNLPNVTSARFRLASGLTFEPLVTFARETDSTDGTTTEDDVTTEVGVAVNVRYPFRANGDVDLTLVGSAGLASLVSDPAGPANSQSVSTFFLGYGIALDYWISPHWNLSMTASNPILVRTSSARDTGEGNPDISQSQTTIGLVFDPTLTLMLHMQL
jgi:hypothetical protein